jgi:hypothetical protein
VPQGVNIHHAGPPVTFGDAGGYQVAVEDSHQPRRNMEERFTCGQPRRQRAASSLGPSAS